MKYKKSIFLTNKSNSKTHHRRKAKRKFETVLKIKKKDLSFKRRICFFTLTTLKGNLFQLRNPNHTHTHTHTPHNQIKQVRGDVNI